MNVMTMNDETDILNICINFKIMIVESLLFYDAKSLRF